MAKRFRKEFVVEFDAPYQDSKEDTSNWLCKENLEILINASLPSGDIKVVSEMDVGFINENYEMQYEGEYCPRCGREQHPVETHVLGFCWACLEPNVKEYINSLEDKVNKNGKPKAA